MEKTKRRYTQIQTTHLVQISIKTQKTRQVQSNKTTKWKIVFIVGKTIAKQTIETKTMEFIKLSDNVEYIQCIAISPTKNHIAVCQKIKNQNFLLLNLYGLKNRDSEIKHFKLPQTQKQSSFKIIAFSPSQPKYACCMTGQPDSQLMFLDISRSRGLAVSNFSVEGTESIAICPTQSHLISCAGRNIFKLFKVQDYAFKTYEEVKKLPKMRNFTSQVWFDKTKILVGSDRGQLFMIGPVGNNFEVKRHLSNVFNIQGEEIIVTAICAFSKGFIIGSNKGHFALWMKKEESEDSFEDQYTGDLIKKWQVAPNKVSSVLSITLCPNEDHIAVAFTSNTLALTSLSTILDSEADSSSKEIDGDIWNYLYNGFHTHQINSLDICLQRPLFATLSKKQNTIRLWNYKKPNCVLVKTFDSKLDGIEQANGQEMIQCLAFHPLGYYMAVGCCDKLRVYHILESELRNYRQIVLKHVCYIKFSNGGQFMAAAYPRQKLTTQKTSIHLINVYNSYTLQQVARLSDHSNMVTQMCWKHDDRSLYSVGYDGTVIQWKQGQTKVDNKEWASKKWIQNNSRYNTIIYQKTGRSLLAAGSQFNKSIVREYRIQKGDVQKLFNIGGFRVSKLQFLTSQWNIPAVIAGTEDGYLKVFNSVFDNIVEQSLNVHRKQITGIVTSPCGRYVITTSKDSSIFIFQVSLTNRQGYVNRRLHDQVNEFEINPLVGATDDDLADIVLVQRNDVNEKNRYNKLLEKNLDQMKKKLVMQEEDDNRRFDKEIQELSVKKQKTIDQLTDKYEELREQKKIIQKNSQSNFLDSQSKNQKMLEDIEVLYQKKLAIQSRKYFELEKQYDREKMSEEKEIELYKNKIHQTLEILKKEFVDCFKKAEKIHNNQHYSIINGEKEFNQKINQIEDQHENQLKKISQEIVKLEYQKNEKSIEYVTNIQSLKRECKFLHDQIIKYMSENQMITRIHEELSYELNKINGQIQGKKDNLVDKQQNLKIREQKLGELKQRITDLQKKKDVLSYRTWEMRQEMEPKEDEIQFLKEQIFSVEKEFEKLLNDEKVLKEVEIKIKKNKQNLLAKLNEQKFMTKDKKNKVKKICEEIDTIVQSKASDRKYYEIEMKKLFDRHGKNMTQQEKLNKNTKGLIEMQRHMNHIDKEIVDVNKKTDDAIRRRDDEIQNATRQNAKLIRDLTDLRQQKIKLVNELKNVEKIVDNLRRQIIQIKNLSANKEKAEQTIIKKAQQMQSRFLPQAPQFNIMRSSSQPNIKGKVARGINYDHGSLSIFTKARLKDLEGKLDASKLNLRQREVMCDILKERIESHFKEQQCSDNTLEKYAKELQL